MVEYTPWSKAVLKKSCIEQVKNRMHVLDLELTAKCSGCSCIYCDSKPAVTPDDQINELDYECLEKIILDSKQIGLEWVYVCGLGEPMEDNKFWKLIELLHKNNIYLSMFSNGVFIKDINIARELKKYNVHIILKMDTFDEKNFDTILGGKGKAKQIYCARDYLIEAGYGTKNKDYTDLAFSIVPTKLSLSGIADVLHFADKYGIFASIGELETAGMMSNPSVFNKLDITEADIVELSHKADEYFEGSYQRPLCPCIFNGIHIDNKGFCLVDKETGLNCKWFMLSEPNMIVLGDVKTEDVSALLARTNNYRKERFTMHFNQIQDKYEKQFVFGGCGGNPKDIINISRKIYQGSVDDEFY